MLAANFYVSVSLSGWISKIFGAEMFQCQMFRLLIIYCHWFMIGNLSTSCTRARYFRHCLCLDSI